ncbi:death domain associated protein [Parasponia andersonii]|uniref:Death domain associated protein n=1 Tax=Parasponia andersonii TaxID=3476 RepID=A0A2P5DQB8_PARAD|nr:death domain associated protein [Parasponia andersonii]
MWTLSYVYPPRPLPLLFPKPTKTSRAVSANSQPPRNDVGGLGRTLHKALESNPKPTNTQNPEQKRSKRVEEEEEEGKQISGSDVLWAMQKAAAKKNKLSVSGESKSKRKKKIMIRGLPSAGGHREEVAGDYSNVRALCIKGEWGAKLDELEKSLEELYETK